MLWHPKTIQNIAIYSVFSFLSVFPLPEADQNDPKFRFNTLLSSDRHPKIVEKTRKHHQYIPVWIRGRTWTPHILVIKHYGPTSVSIKRFHLSKSDLYQKPVPTQGKVPRTEINLLYKKVARLTWLT